MTYKERSRMAHRKEAAFKKAASIICLIGGFAMYIAGLFMVASHPRISTAAIIIGIELALKVGKDNDWFLEDDDEDEKETEESDGLANT